jgi:nitrite reductase/ring-hydroxylating ferredoxin subunit
MAQEQAPPTGPDLAKGIGLADLVDGRLVGHVGNEEVLLVQASSELFAIGAHCAHYHGPLADGLVTGTTVRCPWHHACFDLRNGEAVRAPALSPVECWKVEQNAGRIFVREKREQPKPQVLPITNGVRLHWHAWTGSIKHRDRPVSRQTGG